VHLEKPTWCIARPSGEKEKPEETEAFLVVGDRRLSRFTGSATGNQSKGKSRKVWHNAENNLAVSVCLLFSLAVEKQLVGAFLPPTGMKCESGHFSECVCVRFGFKSVVSNSIYLGPAGGRVWVRLGRIKC